MLMVELNLRVKDDFDFKGVGRMKVYCFISEAQIFS